MDEYGEVMLEVLERLGRIIFKDDEADFFDAHRRFSYAGIPGVKDHPSPGHHWQVGLLMMGGAKVARMVAEFLDAASAFADEDPLQALETLRAELRAGVR